MRRSYFLFVSAATVALCLFAAGAWYFKPPTETRFSPREHAEQLLAECKWQTTIEACDAVLRESPDDGEVLLWRGRARFAIGQFDAAVADFSEATIRLPKNPEPRYFRAMAYEQLGKAELADADFEAARQLDPKKDKLRMAVKKEEAAREVQGIIRETNRVAEERAGKRLEARHAKTDAKIAAMQEVATARHLEEEAKSSAKQVAKQSASDQASADAADDTAPVTSPAADFQRLTSSDFFNKRIVPIGPLHASPDELATSIVGHENSPLADNGADLGRDAQFNELKPDPSGTATPSDTTSPPATKDTAIHKDPFADQPPMSAWERFHQQQISTAQGNSSGQPTDRPNFTPFAQKRESDEREFRGDQTTKSSTTAPAIRPGVGVLNRSWASVSGNPNSAWLNGPLAARATAGQPLSTAQPSPFVRRGPENAFSTATLPLPTPAMDKSMALAMAPPGVLSMAIHELYPPSTSKIDAPLTTQTAPLPAWAPPPASAAPKRR